MMREIVEERDDLLKANQILQALIGNRDKEIDRLREVFNQVKTVCIDNEADTVRHDLALKFVGKLAEKALSRPGLPVGGSPK